MSNSPLDAQIHAFLSENGTVFHQPWWLDAVTNHKKWDWDCTVSATSGEIRAAWPYAWRPVLGRTMIEMPPLTPYLGPVFSAFEGKHTTQLGEQKTLSEDLLGKLPDYAYLNQHFTPDITNWLPFYWKGFGQTTYYTFRFAPEPNLELLHSGLRKNIRRDLREAAKHVEVVETDDFEHVLRLHHLTLKRQNKVLPYPDDYVRAVAAAAKAHQACRILIAIDGKNRVHSAECLLFDRNCVYGFMSGGDPDLRESGAGALVYWTAIQQASRENKAFDFCGSMNEQIEFYLRGYGGTQTPYFVMKHERSAVPRLRSVYWKAKEMLAKHK